MAFPKMEGTSMALMEGEGHQGPSQGWRAPVGLSLKGKAIMAQFIVVAKEAGKGQIDIPDGGEGH